MLDTQRRTTDAYHAVSAYGDDARFVGNVILNWHPNPAKKLSGLAALLFYGHTVRVGAEIDILLVDGRRIAWADLEKFNWNSKPTLEEA